jgi:hypothetical protein
MGISVFDTASLLNTASLGDIKADDFAYIARSNRLPTLKMFLNGGGIRKQQSGDYDRWSLLFGEMDGATYGTDYMDEMRVVPYATNVLAEMRLPIIENSSEIYDVRQVASHAKMGKTRFCDFLKTIQDQNNYNISFKCNRLMLGVPQSLTDKEAILGLQTYAQPSRNAGTGAIEANTAGGYTGQRVFWGNATHTATLNGIDRSLAANAKYRNWNKSIPHEVGAQTIRAIREAVTETGFESLPMASERYSTGNLKGGGSSDPAEINGRSETSTRIILGRQDLHDLQEYVDQSSPDDNRGDAIKFQNTRVGGFKLEWEPMLDPNSDVTMPGYGTVWAYRPMYIFNAAKWKMVSNGGFMDPTDYMPSPKNGYQVYRQRSAQFNIRPTNDIRSAIALLYRTTAS